MADALSRAARDVLGLIAPHLVSGEELPLRWVAQRMGFNSRTSVHNHLAALLKAGLIVRIGVGRYVHSKDPRAAKPLVFGEASFSRPKADAKPVRVLPAMVPGLTIEQLTAGRAWRRRHRQIEP